MRNIRDVNDERKKDFFLFIIRYFTKLIGIKIYVISL